MAGVNIDGNQTEGTNVSSQIVSTESTEICEKTNGTDLMSLSLPWEAFFEMRMALN